MRLKKKTTSNEVVETRAYYTEWSKSEREKQILYNNAYTWNLERWYWWNYFQDSNGDTDTENRLMDTEGGEEEEGRMHEESNMEIYITICRIDSQWEFAVWFRELKLGLCNILEEWDGEEGSRGKDHMYTMADSSSVWQKSAQFCKTFILQLNFFFYFPMDTCKKKEKQQLIVWGNWVLDKVNPDLSLWLICFRSQI